MSGEVTWEALRPQGLPLAVAWAQEASGAPWGSCHFPDGDHPAEGALLRTCNLIIFLGDLFDDTAGMNQKN